MIVGDLTSCYQPGNRVRLVICQSRQRQSKAGICRFSGLPGAGIDAGARQPRFSPIMPSFLQRFHLWNVIASQAGEELS